MKTCETAREMTACSEEARSSGLTIGLVPTMGALHAGHMSLVEKSVSDTDRTVVSIFVNAAQFGPDEDLDEYPRDTEGDLRKLEDAGVDRVFMPTREIIYPLGYATYVVQEHLTEVLCGVSRPAHFRGVMTVVLKLLNIVRPHSAYFGQKDYQQSVVVRRMVEDLNVPVDVIVLPVVREPDGLAMSSRNEYLSGSEREDALCLYNALAKGKEMIEHGETAANKVVASMKAVVERAPSARTDYLSVVDQESLCDVNEINSKVVLVGAVFVGSTRLIDSVMVGRKG